MMYAAASACFFEYPYFLVCCVYTGKSMVFGEVSPVQFSELMSQAFHRICRAFFILESKRIFVRPCCVSPLWRTNG